MQFSKYTHTHKEKKSTQYTKTILRTHFCGLFFTINLWFSQESGAGVITYGHGCQDGQRKVTDIIKTGHGRYASGNGYTHTRTQKTGGRKNPVLRPSQQPLGNWMVFALLCGCRITPLWETDHSFVGVGSPPGTSARPSSAWNPGGAYTPLWLTAHSPSSADPRLPGNWTGWLLRSPSLTSSFTTSCCNTVCP